MNDRQSQITDRLVGAHLHREVPRPLVVLIGILLLAVAVVLAAASIGVVAFALLREDGSDALGAFIGFAVLASVAALFGWFAWRALRSRTGTSGGFPPLVLLLFGGAFAVVSAVIVIAEDDRRMIGGILLGVSAIALGVRRLRARRASGATQSQRASLPS